MADIKAWTDEELEKFINPRTETKRNVRGGNKKKTGPGSLNKFIARRKREGEAFRNKHEASVQQMRESWMGIKGLLPEPTDRPLTKQQLMRKRISDSTSKLKAARLEQKRRLGLTEKEAQAERNQRLLNQAKINIIKKDDGSTPSSEEIGDASSVNVTPDTAPGEVKVDKSNWSFVDHAQYAFPWNKAVKDEFAKEGEVNTQIQELAPVVNPEALDLTKREKFALVQVRGSVAQNKAKLKQIQIDKANAQLGKTGTTEKVTPKVEPKVTPEINLDYKDPKLRENLLNSDLNTFSNPGNVSQLKDVWGKGQSQAISEGAKKTAEAIATEQAMQQAGTEAAASAGAGVPWLMIAKAVTALATDTSQRAAGFKGNQKGSLSKQGSSGLFDDVDPYSWA